MGLINNAVKNIKISHKLYLGFGVVLLLVVLASSLSAMRFHDIRIIYEKTNLIYNINIEVFQAKINRLKYFYTPDDATQTVLSNFIKHASELTQSAHSLPWRPEEQNDLQMLERILADFQQAIKEMSQASQHTVALKKQIAELDGQDAIQRFRDAIAAQPLGLSEYQRADDIAYLSAALRQLASTLYQSDSNDVAQALDARNQAAQQAYQAVLPTLPAETHGLLDELWRYTQRYVALHQEHHSAMATLKKTENAVKVGGDKSSAVIKSLIASIKDQNDRLAYGSAYITLVIGAIAVLIGIVITFYIVRQISRPVQRNLALAERIASGDLTATIQSDSNDELGRLTAAMAQMNSRLHHVIADVRDSVSRVSSSAAEIAAGNSDLASRTEQQSAAVVETAASMEQLTSTVKNNTDNARHASQIASEAAQNAQKGGEVVRNVVTTMDDIAASARKIADITTVINGIAFQTNILALNAAVEAARAGEQGRGFAVVAGEVRALSQRSSQAAKDIAALINESVERTGVGSKLVAEAGQSMESIVNSVARVNDIMEEISSASEEQSRGIEQISRAITELDGTTQQNATRVSASSSSANTLEEQAIVLAQLMATFRLGDSETAPPSRLARPATQALPVKTPVAGNTQDWTHF